MKPNRYVAVFGLLNALTLAFIGTTAHAAQAKGDSARPGAKAEDHMSAKGAANTNAQWSADPKRGWVRAEERHELHGQTKGAKKTKPSRGKSKRDVAPVVKR